MISSKSCIAWAIAVFLLSAVVGAAEKTESFDRDPGWDGHNNRPTAAPVTVLNRTQIESSGRPSIGDILQSIPEQSNAINTQFNNGGDGATRINLRGLGTARTLVLVNGRRFVAGGTGADASVDLNSILIRYTVMGDLNLDKTTSISDFIDLSANFNASGGWRQGDLNYDKLVTISDFIDLSSNFGQALAGDVEPIPAQPMAAESSEIVLLPDALDRTITTPSRKKKAAGARQVVHHRHHRWHPRLAWSGAGK